MAVPFRVFGHARSGNHLLASVLHRALAPNVPGGSVRNSGTGHWSRRRGAARFVVNGVDQGSGMVHCPYMGVLGNHAFPSEGPKGSGRPIYILRDGRDVALSFWRWPKIRRSADQTLEEFLAEPIDWRGSPGSRVAVCRGYTLFDHWRDHVDAWVKRGVLCVRYENLVRDPQAVVRRVAKRLKLPIVGPTRLPKPVGWNPSQGAPNLGTWRDELPESSQALFEDKVPANHVGRWCEETRESRRPA